MESGWEVGGSPGRKLAKLWASSLSISISIDSRKRLDLLVLKEVTHDSFAKTKVIHSFIYSFIETTQEKLAFAILIPKMKDIQAKNPSSQVQPFHSRSDDI